MRAVRCPSERLSNGFFYLIFFKTTKFNGFNIKPNSPAEALTSRPTSFLHSRVQVFNRRQGTVDLNGLADCSVQTSGCKNLNFLQITLTLFMFLKCVNYLYLFFDLKTLIMN